MCDARRQRCHTFTLSTNMSERIRQSVEVRFRRRCRELHPADLVSFADHIDACDDCRHRLLQRGRARSEVATIDADLETLIDHIPEVEVQAYVDGRLDAARRQEIARHLDACPSCAAEIRDLQVVAADVRGRPRSRTAMFAALAAAAVLILIIGASLVSRMAPSRSEEAGLTARQRDVVRQARSTQRLSLPPVLAELAGTRGLLMGDSDPAPFGLLAPIGTAVLDNRPTFRWTAMQGAAQYAVTVLDSTTGEASTSPPLTTTEWTPPFALVRGRVYVWQVAATIDRREVVVPVPPAPPARVLVLDASTAAGLERLPLSPFVRGILYADAGLVDDAERELAAVPAGDPDANVAANLLMHLHEVRGKSSR
jgi:anti-sigma factor RsiW